MVRSLYLLSTVENILCVANSTAPDRRRELVVFQLMMISLRMALERRYNFHHFGFLTVSVDPAQYLLLIMAHMFFDRGTKNGGLSIMATVNLLIGRLLKKPASRGRDGAVSPLCSRNARPRKGLVGRAQWGTHPGHPRIT
jgi:hypothetical protein